MTRGELWWADLGIPLGSEPGFRRPILIIQEDAFNRSRINTTIVVPLTTNLLLAEAPGNVFMDAEATRLAKDSVVVVSQITVIDKARLMEKIEKLSKAQLENIENGIRLVLGM